MKLENEIRVMLVTKWVLAKCYIDIDYVLSNTIKLNIKTKIKINCFLFDSFSEILKSNSLL